jgi:hypothetical protein
MTVQRDTDPDLIPVVHDPAQVFAHETPLEHVDDVNDGNPWFRWSALFVGLAMFVGAAIQWCNR